MESSRRNSAYVPKYDDDGNQGLGLKIAPHDLRRIFARLAYAGNATIEQMQIESGHDGRLTTEKFDWNVADEDIVIVSQMRCEHCNKMYDTERVGLTIVDSNADRRHGVSVRDTIERIDKG